MIGGTSFHYGKAKGFFAKTDKIDARMLANYGQDNDLAESKFNRGQYYIHSLSNRLLQIKEDLMITRCRSSTPSLNSEAKKSLVRQENWLEKELKLIGLELILRIIKQKYIIIIQERICLEKLIKDHLLQLFYL